MKQETFDTEPVTRFAYVCVLLMLLMTCGKQPAFGQPYLFLGVSTNQNGKIAGEAKLGYQIDKITTGYNQRTFFSSDGPSYFGLFTSYDLTDRLAVVGGGYYRLLSKDFDRDPINGAANNYYTIGAGLSYKGKITDYGLYYLDGQIMLSILMGLNFKLFNQ